MSTLPVNEFIVKIASRCNLDCDYCYEYNLGDDSWKGQPAIMSLETAQVAADRIVDHVRSHRLERINVALHGGEPMLAGAAHIHALAQLLRERIGPHCEVDLTMQSNATRVDEQMTRTLVDNKISVGVSIDGPRATNDLHRFDHQRRSSFDATCDGIRQLKAAGVLGGLLSVIDVTSDPLEVFDFIAELGVPNVDFLLPHHNWVRQPPRPSGDPAAYGKWYEAIWQAWVNGRHSWMHIRYLEQMVRTLVGASGLFEGLGLEPVQLLVIATDGTLEGVDTLKSCGDEQQKLHLSVIDSPIDAVLERASFAARQSGANELCQQCLDCTWVKVCGGGYYPHRYRGQRSFAAPSVYCADIMHLLGRIHGDISQRSQRSR